MPGQVNSGVHHPNPSLGGMDGQAGFVGGPAQAQDYQSFNMQGNSQTLIQAGGKSYSWLPMFFIQASFYTCSLAVANIY